MTASAHQPDPFGGASRILFVHAHPDDETISTGALIAHLVAHGRPCLVVTATRGERGAVRPGVLPPGGDLVALRTAEWARACAALGVERHYFLGAGPARAHGHEPRHYADSGMAWADASETVAGPDPDAPADALTAADPDEVADDIAAAASALQVDALVTYDPLGGYGHPDHVFLNAPTLAAARSLGLPSFELVSTPRDGSTPDAPGAVWLNASAARDALTTALGSYASQLRVDGDEIVHVGGQREPLSLRVGVRAV